jgi:hypothetical protein
MAIEIASSIDAEVPECPGSSLGYELEYCLLFGKGSGGQLVLRHADLFAREWHKWREVILPKFIECFPGRRPAAAYISAELPMRPVYSEIPRTHPARDDRTLYVIGESSGFWYRDWPEPYQKNETEWLYEIDAIDLAEARAGRRRSRHQGLRAYWWQQGGIK